MIQDDKNKILLSKDLVPTFIRRFSSALYHTILKRGYKDVFLDFSEVNSAFQEFMVPACAICLRYKNDNVDFEIEPPKDIRLKKLFENANWVSVLCDSKPVTPIDKFDHLPLQIFNDTHQQNEIVTQILKSILTRATKIERSDLNALEWALNEITDNVLTHSSSNIGGLAQCSLLKDRVNFVVCDQGVGIPGTLKRKIPNITNDRKAIEASIRQGVTRDKSLGQGNGLFGAWEITRLSGGLMSINSGKAYIVHKNGKVNLEDIRQTFQGTLVICSIKFGSNELLKSALKFGEKPYTFVDFQELKYENKQGDIQINLVEETPSVRTRTGGDSLKQKIRNLIHLNPGKKILINFKECDLISSSFADEVFAKLIIELGFCKYFQLVKFVNINEVIISIIDRAIMQRCGTNFAEGYLKK